ncbi:hypothetical protein AAF712_011945 [Marasmius tenuissimus]|uniref:Uncharacterized protein n=1 Tax=Marasmius tenuissimus TaxID=585030 RepID=A0ABR2ZJT9_9AGAR
MPARRKHKTKVEQEQATRNKHKAYYACNQEMILAKKRTKYTRDSINDELWQSATQSYFERLYYEYQAWHSCDPQTKNSPIELPFKLFSSMTNAVAKIGNAILNEFGAGKEWNECWRLTKRIRYFILCIDDMEIAVLEGNNLLEA